MRGIIDALYIGLVVENLLSPPIFFVSMVCLVVSCWCVCTRMCVIDLKVATALLVMQCCACSEFLYAVVPQHTESFWLLFFFGKFIHLPACSRFDNESEGLRLFPQFFFLSFGFI